MSVRSVQPNQIANTGSSFEENRRFKSHFPELLSFSKPFRQREVSILPLPYEVEIAPIRFHYFKDSMYTLNAGFDPSILNGICVYIDNLVNGWIENRKGKVKLHQTLTKLGESVNRSVENYTLAKQALDEFFKTPDIDLQDALSYEKAYQKLLLDKENAIQDVLENAKELQRKTNHKHRKKFRKDNRITTEEKPRLEELEKSALEIQNFFQRDQSNTHLLLEKSRKSEAYFKELLKMTPSYKRFLEIAETLCNPSTSEEQQESLKKELSPLKDEIDTKLKRLNEISPFTTPKELISIREILDRSYESALFYARSEHDNLSELEDLFTQNPEEYLLKSIFYTSKLVGLENYESAINYATKWMQAPSKNTSWQDVLTMGKAFVQAAQKHTEKTETRVDSSKFRNALEDWMAAHPDLLSKVTPNEKLTGAENLEILRSSLYDLSGDRSFDAFKCYKKAEALMPDLSLWKRNQALVHISALQWSQAKSRLDELSPEDQKIVRQSVALSQFKAHSFGVDLVDYVTSQWIFPGIKNSLSGEQVYIQKGLTFLEHTIHVIANPIIQSYWIPRTTDYPQETLQDIKPNFISLSLCGLEILNKTAISPLLEYAIPSLKPRLQYKRKIDLTINSLAIGNTIWTLTRKENLSVASVGRSFLSLATFCESWVDDQGNLQLRTALKLARKTGGRLLPLDLLGKNTNILASLGKWIFFQSGRQPLHSRIVALIKPLSKLATPIQGLFIGFYVYRDYPPARSAVMMEEAIHLYSEEKHQEAKNLLQKAQKEYLIDRKAIASFTKAAEIFELMESLKENDGRLQTVILHVNQAIKILQDREYVGIRNHLVYRKITSYLKTGQYSSARASIKDSDPITQDLIFISIIEQIKQLDSLEKTKTSLKIFEEVPTFTSLVDKYLRYFSHQGKHPKLTEKSSQKVVKARVERAQDLIDLLKPKTALSQLYIALQLDLLILYVNIKDYKKTNALLSDLGPDTHASFIFHLINRAESLYKKEKYGKAKAFLEDVDQALDSLKHGHLLMLYRQYIDQIKKNSTPGQIFRLNAVIKACEKDKSLSFLLQYFLDERVRLLINTNQYAHINTLLLKSKFQETIKVHLLKRAFLISKNDEVNIENAVDYLRKIKTHLVYLSDHGVIDLFKSVLEHKSISTQEQLTQWSDAVDRFIEKTNSIKKMRSLIQQILEERFSICIRLGNYRDARQVLEHSKINPSLRTILMNHLAFYLINESEILSRKSTLERAQVWLKSLTENTNLENHTIIHNYFDFFLMVERIFSGQNSIQNLNTAISSINLLFDSLRSANLVIPDLLKERKAQMHIRIGNIEQKNGRTQKASESYLSARRLFPERGKTEQQRRLIQFVESNLIILTKKMELSK